MESDTSSDTDNEYSETIEELLIEKDKQIDDLLTKVIIINKMNAILCDRIKNLQDIISSNLPNHLNAILEFL
jgi:hypothetical protein